MTIGEKIKYLRRKNDVTQEKLADYLNISYQAISKWENNSTLPDISLVLPLASFFGVSTDALFDMKRHCHNILIYTELLTTALWCCEYDTEDKQVSAYEAALKIWGTVINDGNYMFFHCRLQFIYKQLAYIYARRCDKEKTLDCLQKSMHHAKEYDRSPDTIENYTGTFIDKAEYSPGGTTKNYSGTIIQLLQDDFRSDHFDFLKDDSTFQALRNTSVQ